MPAIYLSPSLQLGNKCILGDTEAIHMNYVADAMVPLFPINGVTFSRNNLSQTLSQVIAESNRGNYDLHIALHSNAAPPATAGKARGSRYYYYATSARGRDLANIAVENFKNVYPLPDRVISIPTTDLVELAQVRAVAVLAEVAFHDNLEDARWLHDNIQLIAQTLMQSICDYFGKSYIPPCIVGSVSGTQYVYTGLAYGFVCTDSGSLNVRATPNGAILFTLQRGAQVIVLSGRQNGFIKIRHNHSEGYVSERFLCICRAPVLPFSAKTGVVSTVSSSLNLRQSASLSSNVIASMPRGSTVVVLGQSGSFYEINFNGIVGYAASAYIKV